MTLHPMEIEDPTKWAGPAGAIARLTVRCRKKKKKQKIKDADKEGGEEEGEPEEGEEKKWALVLGATLLMSGRKKKKSKSTEEAAPGSAEDGEKKKVPSWVWHRLTGRAEEEVEEEGRG